MLEDTLLVHRVDAFARSATRRLVQHPKVFFFDVGVLNGLLGNFVASPDRISRLFVHLVHAQLVHSAAAFDDDARVERELGGGGMSRVFIAQKHALGRDVAVKVLSPRETARSHRVQLEREQQRRVGELRESSHVRRRHGEA